MLYRHIINRKPQRKSPKCVFVVWKPKRDFRRGTRQSAHPDGDCLNGVYGIPRFLRQSPMSNAKEENACKSTTYQHVKGKKMARQGAVTFKGNPMTLVGDEVQVGNPAPPFEMHAFEDGGLVTITPADLKGKPTLLNVVPSLDTGVCQIQTKQFNEQLAGLSDKVNALTVSLDLPFAQTVFAERRTSPTYVTPAIIKAVRSVRIGEC